MVLSVFSTLVLLSASFPACALGATSSEVRAEAEALMESLDELQTEINEAQAAYDEASAAYDEAIDAMEEAQERIEDAEERIEANQERLEERAVAIYRNGSISMIDVLLESSSFIEFVTLANTVNRINNYNAEVVSVSKEARDEAESARAEYERLSQVAQEQMQAAEDAEAQLTAKAEEMQTEISRLTAEAAELQAEEEAAAAEAQRAAEAAAQAASSLGYYEESESVISGSGQFTHPCPGYTSVSSTFGYRSFDSSFHKGIDFAASQGTPIYAADSGTVLIAGYSSSAGNWVVISHGNGLTTKYMHMAQTPFVVAGETVTKGQNIGVVGSTGNSTGPHLHFQVEVDGSAVNPLYYL